MVTLILIVSVALCISFVCSLWEAALLSVRTVRLASLAKEGDRSAATVLRLKTVQLDESLSAILTLNTISHTVGAASAGAQAARVFGDGGVGIFSAVLTLLVLVLTEAIPKTLGANYAPRLVGFLAWSLGFLVKTPLALLAWFTRRLSRGHAPSAPTTQEILLLVDTANSSGQMEPETSNLVTQLLETGDARLASLVVPRVRLPTLPNDCTFERAREQASNLDCSWALIDAGTGGDNWLFVSVDRPEIPDEALCRDFANPKLMLPEMTSVSEALLRWLHDPRSVIGVFDEFGNTTGLVSLEQIQEAFPRVQRVPLEPGL